jgi:hypothetical protein
MYSNSIRSQCVPLAMAVALVAAHGTAASQGAVQPAATAASASVIQKGNTLKMRPVKSEPGASAPPRPHPTPGDASIGPKKPTYVAPGAASAIIAAPAAAK